jgi:NADPH2:quinone reductase
MAKNLGATVIGTVSTQAKAERAKQAGADHMILYTEQDFEAELKKFVGGKGVDVVYDSVGASTFLKSLNCLRPRGMMCTFGNASGPAPAIEPLLLTQKGSLFLARPKLTDHLLTRQELEWRACDVLSSIAAGKLTIHIEKEYPLSQAAQAHQDLESRKTTGKLLLIPE